MPPVGLSAPILFTAQQWGAIVVVLLLGLGLKALVLWWLYRDTIARDRDPLRWILFAVVVDIPTLIVWLIVRPRLPEEERPRRNALAFPPGAPGAGPAGQAPGPHREAVTPGLARTPAPTPGSEPRSEARGPRTRLTCPRCGHGFAVERAAEGPTPIACPECGMTGRL